VDFVATGAVLLRSRLPLQWVVGVPISAGSVRMLSHWSAVLTWQPVSCGIRIYVPLTPRPVMLARENLFDENVAVKLLAAVQHCTDTKVHVRWVASMRTIFHILRLLFTS
jgi:hypothetical protein